MNTIKFATFSIPSSELIKQSKDTGISMLVAVGEQHKSFTLIGQRELPQLVSSIDRTTIQKPTGFTELEAKKILIELDKSEFDAIPTPQEISQAITSVTLARYI